MLALYEQDQQQMANQGPVPPAPPPPPDAQNQPPQQQLQPGQPEQPQQGQPQMTIDSMIERLNVIRGGKSFTDPEVYGQLVTFFKKITPEQNQVIDQYLQDMAKIMVNVRTGDTAGTEQASAPGQQPNPPASGGGAPQGPISPSGSATSGGMVGGAGTPGGGM